MLARQILRNYPPHVVRHRTQLTRCLRLELPRLLPCEGERQVDAEL